MKKYLAGLILLAAIFVILVLTQKPSSPSSLVSVPISSPTATSVLDLLESINFNNQTYRFAWVKITDVSKLNLFLNHIVKTPTQELIKNCSSLVSGGFYDQAGEPIGWLVSNGQLISSPVVSRFLNGYLSFANQTISIDNLRPQNQVNFGLQSGPLLIYQGQALPLTIKADEPDRRLIAALNQAGDLLFLVIAGDTSVFSGPLLADTPELVMAASHQIGEEIVTALNLDGGSASAFYANNIYLEEFSWIANYFCAAL